MLSKEDNQLLCRVGPGTPMGDLMRQYWLPAIRSDELPASDCPPLRVKLLGEELIGFRMTSGRVGLIQNACPHRGASLYYGRNEDEGLRRPTSRTSPTASSGPTWPRARRRRSCPTSRRRCSAATQSASPSSTAPATGCRGWRASSTRCTPPSSTGASTSPASPAASPPTP